MSVWYRNYQPCPFLTTIETSTHSEQVAAGEIYLLIEFFTAHWRGKIALYKASWLVGATLTVLIVLVDDFSRFGVWQREIVDHSSYVRFAWTAAILLCAVPVWQIVGLWRAADYHVAHVGTILAGRGAQMLATLLMIFSLVRFAGFIETVSDQTPPLFALGDYAADVRVLPNGREIVINGGLGTGLTERVTTALALHPQVRRVRLDSVVGLASEAQMLAELIGRHSLNTYVIKHCEAACIIPFLAGEHRYLQRNANVLFTNDDELPAAQMEFLLRRGVQVSFLQTWRTVGSRGWRPSTQDLRAAGIVHTMLGDR